MSETYYVKTKNRIIGILDLPNLKFELDNNLDYFTTHMRAVPEEYFPKYG